MENNDIQIYPPKKSKKGLWIATAATVVVVAAIAIYIVLSLPRQTAVSSSTPTPQIPSKSEVSQIMTSVDDKIEQASADQASASAALEEASTPVEVDL